MSSFIETQRLAKIQPSIIPLTRRKRRGRKGRKSNRGESSLHQIVDLPLDLLMSVSMFGESLPFFLLFMRTISSTFCKKVDQSCFRWCSGVVSFDETINATKLFFNIAFFIDITLKKDDKICFKGNGNCNKCYNNRNGLLINKNGRYKCAFKCRRYYCPNRSCNSFGDVHFEYNVPHIKCYCGVPLRIHIGGTDPTRCLQNSSSARSYERCYDGRKLANMACDDCLELYGNDHIYWNGIDTDSDEYDDVYLGILRMEMYNTFR